MHCFIKGGIYLVHKCTAFIHSPNKASFTNWLVPWQWQSPSFSWKADRRLWNSGAVFCGGTDVVDVVERSVLRLGADDADKAGIFWFRLGLSATFVVFAWEKVGAGPFSFNARAIFAETTAVASTTLHHFPWGLTTKHNPVHGTHFHCSRKWNIFVANNIRVFI